MSAMSSWITKSTKLDSKITKRNWTDSNGRANVELMMKPWHERSRQSDDNLIPKEWNSMSGLTNDCLQRSKQCIGERKASSQKKTVDIFNASLGLGIADKHESFFHDMYNIHKKTTRYGFK